MWEIIQEPEDLLIVRDWLLDINAEDYIIKNIEYLIKKEKWPFKNQENDYYWQRRAKYNSYDTKRFNEVIDKRIEFFDWEQGKVFTKERTLPEAIQYYCEYK